MAINSVGPAQEPAATHGEPNKALNGHKLIIVNPSSPPQGFVDRLHRDHPGLKVVFYETDRASRALPTSIPDDDWKDATILLTSGRALPSPEKAPKLAYVQITSAGANPILNHPLFADTDISFCTANGVHGPQITEWVIGTYLAAQHKIPEYLDRQRQAKWQRGGELIDDAVGQRVGILGYGSIGRQVARVSKALGFEVHAYTLHAKDTPEARRDDAYTPAGLGDPEGVLPAKWFSGGSTEDLHRFLASGLDLLVVSLPLTDKTRGLLATPEFEILAPRATFLSNIARGPIVDTDDLITALDRGLLRGAALDVTDPEPLTDGHPLWSAKNAIITPHVSGMSSAYDERVFAILEQNIGRLSEGKSLTNEVSRREGY